MLNVGHKNHLLQSACSVLSIFTNGMHFPHFPSIYTQYSYMIFVIPKQHQKVLIEKANKLNGWISDWGKDRNWFLWFFFSKSPQRLWYAFQAPCAYVGELLIYVPNKVNLHVNGHLFRWHQRPRRDDEEVDDNAKRRLIVIYAMLGSKVVHTLVVIPVDWWWMKWKIKAPCVLSHYSMRWDAPFE